MHSLLGRSLPVEAPPPVTVRRFSVDEYRRLTELGVLAEDDRVELLEGWIVPKMPHNPPHDSTIQILEQSLRPRLPEGWCLRIQSTITTADSEPEPDLAIVRGMVRSFTSRHPTPEQTGLVIEIADASLSRDRDTKLRLYARAGIESYWIVNLVGRQVEVHEGPTGDASEPAYRSRTIYRESENVPFSLGGRLLAELPVASLLP